MTIAGNSSRCRSLSHLESLSGHSRLLQIGGGLLAGAAAIGAGYHAWEENKGRTEEEVGLLPHSHSDFSLLTLVEETSPHVGFAEMAA
jgi:hypothetical protein